MAKKDTIIVLPHVALPQIQPATSDPVPKANVMKARPQRGLPSRWRSYHLGCQPDRAPTMRPPGIGMHRGPCFRRRAVHAKESPTGSGARGTIDKVDDWISLARFDGSVGALPDAGGTDDSTLRRGHLD